MTDPVRAEIVHADDPTQQGRVMVRSPAMGENWESWAQVLRPAPDAPPPAYAPDDVVMIHFEGGDPGSPFVLGAVSWRRRPVEALVTALPRTPGGWDDLAVSRATQRTLGQIVASAASGATVLFSGPSGAGKTLAAQIIAKELGSAVLKVDLSRVISKYVGETGKNLDVIFAEAEASNAVLLFDEADALFGKRSEVRDSHDRHANIEVSYLLQRLEAHPGLIILTTALKQNIDPAFTRRLAATVSFSPPPR